MLTKLHAGNDARVGTTAIGIQDLDGDELDLLGDTKVPAANGASNVGSVTVPIRILKET